MDKAIFQNQPIQGVKLGGILNGTMVKLNALSIKDIAGVSVSGKGRIENYKTLSGLDGAIFGEISDIPRFARFASLDVSQ